MPCDVRQSQRIASRFTESSQKSMPQVIEYDRTGRPIQGLDGFFPQFLESVRMLFLKARRFYVTAARWPLQTQPSEGLPVASHRCWKMALTRGVIGITRRAAVVFP